MIKMTAVSNGLCVLGLVAWLGGYEDRRDQDNLLDTLAWIL
jgi:hypothetical protein